MFRAFYDGSAGSRFDDRALQLDSDSFYYWDDKNMQEIAEMQGYANADSAKSQKNKCMNKLRVYIKNFLE